MEDKRILIADAEEGIRDMIKEYISLDGFAVDEAADGEEALALLEKNNYALLLLDVMMPDMDGLETLKKIREKYHHLRADFRHCAGLLLVLQHG